MTREEALKIWLPVIAMGIDNMPELKEALDMAIKALEQEPKWIHVSERLPEKDGEYLVTVSSFCGLPQRIEVLSFATDLHKIDEYDFPEHKCGFYDYDSEWGYLEVDDVLAWMPSLPEPYKEESENKE